jgi:class 3 adenylate cyclase
MATELAQSSPGLAEFLKKHPWPAADAALGARIEGLWSFELAAPPEKVWPFVSDTSRFNRAMGMTQMEFFEREGKLHGRAVNAGMLSEWVEVPWVWVAERSLTCVRRYSRGFAHVMRSVYELVPLEQERCRLDVYFGFVPRGLLGRLLLRLGLGSIRSGFERVIAEIDAHLAQQQENPYVPPPHTLPPGIEARLSHYRTALAEHGIEASIMDKISAYVRSADDMSLHRLRILPLAREWGVAVDDLLLAFLHATRLGLFELSWDVVCPHCRGVRAEIQTLGEVPRRGRCDACSIDFETDTETAIEVVFHLHPSIRDVPEVFYCSAEPARKDHVKLQLCVEPGQKLRVATRLYPGRYRMRIVGAECFGYMDVSADSAAESVAWRASVVPEEDLTAASHPELELDNDTVAERTFIIENVHWSDDALRPARLFSFQGFRDLFTEEYVGSEIQLSVGQQTILFTDVVGSTELYAERGDPGAFVDVKRHFADIYEEVCKNSGAIVKTIGDAAMASFVDPVAALRAAQGIQLRLCPGRDDLALRVRASLNTGPCIAVKLNTNIDYFGSTVNAAAKLQACAAAGQVAFPERLLEVPAVAAFLAEQDAQFDVTEFSSPALGGKINVRVWNVSVEPRSE